MDRGKIREVALCKEFWLSRMTWIYALTKHERVVFSVENTGVHIPTDRIRKLFDAFYRVEQSRNGKTGGSGPGLYIVQEILRRHESVFTVCNTQFGVSFLQFDRTWKGGGRLARRFQLQSNHKKIPNESQKRMIFFRYLQRKDGVNL